VILITLLLLSCSYFIQSSENQVQPPLRERKNLTHYFAQVSINMKHFLLFLITSSTIIIHSADQQFSPPPPIKTILRTYLRPQPVTSITQREPSPEELQSSGSLSPATRRSISFSLNTSPIEPSDLTSNPIKDDQLFLQAIQPITTIETISEQESTKRKELQAQDIRIRSQAIKSFLNAAQASYLRQVMQDTRPSEK